MTTIAINPARVPRKARTILNKLVQTRQLTTTGLNWLIAATDPFHDTEIAVQGYPDIAVSRSLVQCVTRTITVKTPLSTDDNWDCHVFFVPLTYSFGSQDNTPTYNSAYYRNLVDASGNVTGIPNYTTTSHVFGGVNVIGVPEGQAWNNTTNASITDAVAFQPEFATDTYRMVACGFEVTNVTSQLYKGGSLTAYRNPSRPTPFNLITQDGTSFTCECVAAPPLTQSDAAVYPDSKTWRAEDGAYCVVTFNDLENPYYTPSPSFGGMMQPLSDTPTFSSVYSVWLPAYDAGELTTTPNGGMCTVIRAEQPGVILAGLPAQSAIQITSRVYYERVPSPSDQALQVLTHPAPPFDPLAFDLYSRCMSELPIAVPVGENPLGEWFADVMSTIGEWAPKIGGFLSSAGVPFAGAIGEGLGMIGNGVAGLVRPPKSVSTIADIGIPVNAAARNAVRNAKKRARKKIKRQVVRLAATELAAAKMPIRQVSIPSNANRFVRQRYVPRIGPPKVNGKRVRVYVQK